MRDERVTCAVRRSGLPDGDDDTRCNIRLHDGRRAEPTPQVVVSPTAAVRPSLPARPPRSTAARRHRRPARVRRRPGLEATRRLRRAAVRHVGGRGQRLPADDDEGDADEARVVDVSRLFRGVPLAQ